MDFGNNTCYATLKYAPSSIYKWELVADLIRNLPIDHALDQLSFSKKACALPMRKLIQSCIANGVNNNGFDKSNLVVYRVFVGKAFTLKRFMPCGRGRSSRIEKRYTKVTLVLKSVPLSFAGDIKKIKKDVLLAVRDNSPSSSSENNKSSDDKVGKTNSILKSLTKATKKSSDNKKTSSVSKKKSSVNKIKKN